MLAMCAGAPSGYRVLYAAPPANVESLYRFSAPSASNGAAAAAGTATGGVLLNLLTRRDELGANATTASDPQVCVRACMRLRCTFMRNSCTATQHPIHTPISSKTSATSTRMQAREGRRFVFWVVSYHSKRSHTHTHTYTL